MKLLILPLLCLYFSACVLGLNTGVKTTLSQNGLNYIKDVGVALIQKQLATVVVPDINGRAGTPLGDIDYSLTSIVITGLTIPSVSTSIVPGQGLVVSVSGVSCHVNMRWHYRQRAWPHISDGGSADVQISGTSVSVTAVVGMDSTGRPTVKAANCQAHVGGLSIDLHGGASWLYNLFTGLFSGQIKSSVESSLRDSITDAINTQAAEALATVPIEEKIDDVSEINFQLTATPVFEPTYLATGHLGEFYQIGNHQECPYTAASMPDSQFSTMLQVFVSDYTLNSAGYVYYKAGELVAVVNPPDVPSWSPVKLNTASFKALIPQLYALYPNEDMQLVLQSTAPPVAHFTPEGATFSVPGECVVKVTLANGTDVTAFTIDILGMLAGKAAVQDTNLVGELSFINASLALNSSSIGHVEVSALQDLINLMCQDGIVPLLNIYAGRGFPLPVVEGVSLVNPQISFGPSYLAVATDLQYTPTQKRRSTLIPVM